jgi:hypothetical protein
LDCLSDQEVVARYRLDKAAIYELESICRQDLSPLTGRSFAVSSLTKVKNTILLYSVHKPIATARVRV